MSDFLSGGPGLSRVDTPATVVSLGRQETVPRRSRTSKVQGRVEGRDGSREGCVGFPGPRNMSRGNCIHCGRIFF